MAKPKLYHRNLLSLGSLSGSNDDASNSDTTAAVRRIADADITEPYQIISGAVTSGVTAASLSGAIALTGVSQSATHFVKVRAENASGLQATVAVDGADYGPFTLGSDGHAEVFALSGGEAVSGDVWLLVWDMPSGVTFAGTPRFYELMLATELPLPRRPQVGVQRSRVHQLNRTDPPGQAAFITRLGGDYRETQYDVVATQSEVTSGFEAFVSENDGGEPFVFLDEDGEAYWAELADDGARFNDEAGVYSFAVSIREIVAE